MSQFSSSIDTLSPSDFCEAIISQTSKGFGFIPFVGSGLSANSGILTGEDFSVYLAFVLHQCLTNRWDIRSEGWPATPSDADVAVVRKWFLSEFRKCCLRIGIDPIVNKRDRVAGFGRSKDKSGLGVNQLARPMTPEIISSRESWSQDQQLLKMLSLQNLSPSQFAGSTEISPSSYEHVVDYSIRCCYSWQVTLTTLARLRVWNEQVFLDDQPNSSVFDSFNAHITRDRQPNLGHKMLAHLSRPLRTRVILTTNFDTLIEDAFKRIHRELNVFSVQKNGYLPDPQMVRAADCVIKMHGSLMDTRADLSLNTPPNEKDCQRFSTILSGRELWQGSDLQERGEDYRSLPCHLLVMGYSASDMRCVELIKQAIRRSGSRRSGGLHVYWVCFKEADLERLRTVFSEGEICPAFHTCVTSRPDLLLYELFQRICLSLPSGGSSYQYSARIPATRTHPRITQHQVDDARARFESPFNNLSLEHHAANQKGLVKTIISQAMRDAILTKLIPDDKPFKADVYADYFRISEVVWNFSDPRLHLRKLSAAQTAGIVVVENASGSLDAIAEVLGMCRDKCRKKTIFEELQDYSHPRMFLRDVVLNLALETGTFQSEAVNLLPKLPTLQPQPTDTVLHQDKPFVQSLQDYAQRLELHLKLLFQQLQIRPDDWIIAIYARSGYGCCSAWGDCFALWSDDDSNRLAAFAEFWTILSVLNKAGFSLVYFPMEARRVSLEENKWEAGRQAAIDLQLVPANWNPPREEPTSALWDGEFPFRANRMDPFYDTFQHQQERAQSPSAKDHQLHYSEFQDIVTTVLQGFVEPYFKFPEPDRNFEKLSLLYAALLFRQSRHQNIFSSIATFRCPDRFNGAGLDNDCKRALVSDEWLNELLQARVFLEKTGGYFWMHRDLRKTLLILVESIQFNGTGGRQFTLDQSRSSLHFTIADWYQQAFFTTRHFIPLVEAIFHYYQSAIFSRIAQPVGKTKPALKGKPLTKYRTYRLHRALITMIKLLDHSRSTILFWMSDGNGVPMFEAGQIDKVSASLKETVSQIAGTNDGERAMLESIIESAVLRLQAIGDDIRDEKNVHSEHQVSLHQFKLICDDSTSQNINDFQATPRTDMDSEDWSDNWKTRFKELGAPGFSELISRTANDPFDDAPRIRAQLVSEIKYQSSHLYSLIEHCGEFAYISIRRAHLECSADHLRCFNFSNSPAMKQIQFLHRLATVFANSGLSACTSLDPLFIDQELLLRAKLSTLYGLALGYLGRFYEAHRRLTESQRYLSAAHDRLTVPYVQHAMLRLRRAEVYMLQSREILELFTDSANEVVWPTEALDGFVEKWHEKAFHRTVEELKGFKQSNSRVPTLIRLCWAYLDDSASMLELARKMLSGTSQHSLWWGRLYTLELENFALENRLRAICQLSLVQDSSHRFRSIRGIIRRKPIEYQDETFRLLIKGLATTSHSELRQLRLLEGFLAANNLPQKGQFGERVGAPTNLLRWHTLSESQVEFIDQTFQDLEYRLDKNGPHPKTRAYLNNLIALFEEFKG